MAVTLHDTEMTDSNNILDRQQRNLRIVLVLSIIGSGYCLIDYLYMGIALPILERLFQDGTMAGPLAATSRMFGVDPQTFSTAFEEMLGVPRVFYFMGALLYGVSLAGVILMWRLRRVGFHLYAIAQLLMLICTIVFLGRSHVGLGDIMFTVLFIGYYFIALKSMGVFDSDDASPKDTPSPQDGNSLPEE
ncbi:MAG: hypothetical protein K6E93_08520 [Bacteroidales bacterium]|nr:hypothetical protein [Bacteroidales bacterium]